MIGDYQIMANDDGPMMVAMTRRRTGDDDQQSFSGDSSQPPLPFQSEHLQKLT